MKGFRHSKLSNVVGSLKGCSYNQFGYFKAWQTINSQGLADYSFSTCFP